MSHRCKISIAWEALVDYAAGDCSDEETERIEEHLMGCGECAKVANRALAIAVSIHELPAPVIAVSELEALRAGGARITETQILPSVRTPVAFTPDTDMLVHHLCGLDLRESESVRVTIRAENTGEVLFQQAEAPFDRAAGEVLVTCQRHFSVFPPEIEFEVAIRQRNGEETTVRFLVPHLSVAAVTKTSD